MTSPSVQGTAATTAISGATTSHTVNLPSGMIAGELITLIFGTGADAVTISVAGSWTALLGGTNALPGGTGTGYAARIIADNTLAGTTTVVVTTGASVESAAICFRSKHYLSSGPFSGANSASGTSASPDCTNFGPIASDDMLVIAAYFADGTDLQGVPVYPSGYTALAQLESGASATTSITVGAGWKAVTGTDEDPGSFLNTLTASQEWLAYTLAIASGTGGDAVGGKSPLTGGMREMTGGIRG